MQYRLRLRSILVCLGLASLVLVVYGQVIHFDFINYDDPEYVVNNPHVTAPFTSSSISWALTSGYAANWHPLTWLSHMLDFQLFGLKSGLHHLPSVVLHIASTLLLFGVLWRMTGEFWPPLVVAALFGLHPLRAESVAWVSERKDALSTFFWMLTLMCYAKYVERPNVWRYVLIVISFSLGLMAKPMLVTLPAALLLLDFWPLQRLDRSTFWRRVLEKGPLFAISAAVGVVVLIVQHGGGAVATFQAVPVAFRAENAMVAIAAYLGMLAWPRGLAPFYPLVRVIPLWHVLLALLTISAVSALVLLKKQTHEYLIVGWLWYLITLVPVLGLIQVGGQARADRYTYVPTIGILVMIVWSFQNLVKSYPRLKPLAATAACVALAVCVGLSVVQVSYWRNTTTLFTHAAAVTTDNYVAYNSLGAELLSGGKPAEALPYFSRALASYPDMTEAHTNMGMAMDDLGQRSQAIQQFQKAIHLDPNDAEAQAGLGLALTETGAGDEGISHLREALRIQPDSAHYQFELGEAYGAMDRIPEAEQAFRESIRLDPADARARFNLGMALGKQNKLKEAVGAFREATRIKPDYVNAWFNLGNALAQDGQLNEAAAAFTEATHLNPDFADARDSLAAVQQLLRNQ